MKIFSEKLKGFKDICSCCHDDSHMYATGYLYNDNITKKTYWDIEFACEKSGELVYKWHVDYEKIIKEALQENGIIQ